jgi:hypothetical protein
MINVLDKSYSPIFKIQLDQIVKNPVAPKIKSICVSNDQKRTIIVGTFGSEIYELSPK